MEEFKQIGREVPYALREGAVGALQGRILSQTTRKSHVERNLWRWPVAVGLGVVMVGVVCGVVLYRQPEGAVPDFEEMLANAPAETLQQAASTNYDEIFFNQEL